MRNLIPVILLSAVILGFSPQLKAQKEGKPAKKDVLITMTTAYGDMNIILFDETPKHKANFIKLAEEGFYDQTLFHRVMLGFMIQGGDPNTKPGGNRKAAGQGGPGYTIPAEFVKGIKHEKGSLAAARQNDRVNPQKESSGSQFYIVHNAKACRHLNGGYTVFGKVVKGIEVVDKIAAQEINRRNKMPLEDVPMTVTAKNLSKKKITKLTGYEYPGSKKKKKKKAKA